MSKDEEFEGTYVPKRNDCVQVKQEGERGWRPDGDQAPRRVHSVKRGVMVTIDDDFPEPSAWLLSNTKVRKDERTLQNYDAYCDAAYCTPVFGRHEYER